MHHGRIQMAEEKTAKASDVVKTRKIRSIMDVKTPGDMIALWILYFIKFMRWLVGLIKRTLKKQKASATPKPLFNPEALAERIRKKERIDPYCKYADCLISLPSCTMLEPCLLNQLKRMKE